MFSDHPIVVTVKLVDLSSCQITALGKNLIIQFLDTYKKEASSYACRSVSFQYTLKEDHILMTGNIIDGINALYHLDLINEQIHDQIIQKIVTETMKQASDSVSPRGREYFVRAMQNIVTTLQQSQQQNPLPMPRSRL